MPNIVLITGASSGIGRATAELFLARGWSVAATARRPESLEDLARSERALVAVVAEAARSAVPSLNPP